MDTSCYERELETVEMGSSMWQTFRDRCIIGSLIFVLLNMSIV